jgi:hypothetical protein
MTMAQWIVVPDAFYDDPETFAAWARRAHALAPPKLAKVVKKKQPATKKASTRR